MTLDLDALEAVAKAGNALDSATCQALIERLRRVTEENARLRKALLYARPIVVKWCYTQGNNAQFICETTAPIDAALSPSPPQPAGPITIAMDPREDGGLRMWSDELPGLVLSHPDHDALFRDLPLVIKDLFAHGGYHKPATTPPLAEAIIRDLAVRLLLTVTRFSAAFIWGALVVAIMVSINVEPSRASTEHQGNLKLPLTGIPQPVRGFAQCQGEPGDGYRCNGGDNFSIFVDRPSEAQTDHPSDGPIVFLEIIALVVVCVGVNAGLKRL